MGGEAAGGAPSGMGGDEAGSAGMGGNPCDCPDDGNPCTDDVCSEQGCVHANNDAACDDGIACTLDDRCESGVCVGDDPCQSDNVCTVDRCQDDGGCTHEVASGSATDDENQHIPDNPCGVPPEDQVLSTVTLPDPGKVASVEVVLDLKHDFVGDIAIELSHADVTAMLVNQPVDMMRSNGGRLNGVYTFRDGSMPMPVRPPGMTIPPSTYRPLESFSAFEGLPAAGDWTIRIADYCDGDDGDFSRFTLHVTTSCSGAESCDGTCNAGACECD